MKGKTKILIKGHLDPKWADWFEGMAISHEGENTSLVGEIKDDALMYGILNRFRDLNLSLISINPLNENNNNVL